jgi:hypothetical protein
MWLLGPENLIFHSGIFRPVQETVSVSSGKKTPAGAKQRKGDQRRNFLRPTAGRDLDGQEAPGWPVAPVHAIDQRDEL